MFALGLSPSTKKKVKMSKYAHKSSHKSCNKNKTMNGDRRIKSKRLNAVKITFLKRQESKPLMGMGGREEQSAHTVDTRMAL